MGQIKCGQSFGAKHVYREGREEAIICLCLVDTVASCLTQQQILKEIMMEERGDHFGSSLGGKVQSTSKSIAFEGAIASVLQIQKEAQIWVSCMMVKKGLYIDFMTACISSKKSLVKL